jgi:hypothetical protein
MTVVAIVSRLPAQTWTGRPSHSLDRPSIRVGQSWVVSYPTICEKCPLVAIKAHWRWRLRWGIISVPRHIRNIAHPLPDEVIGVADIPVPIYWVGDTVTGLRYGLPWAPMTWWTPIAVVCGDRETGLGLGGALAHGQTQTARRQRSGCQPHDESRHKPGTILLRRFPCPGTTRKSRHSVHGWLLSLLSGRAWTCSK